MNLEANPPTLVERLRGEADLCRNDGADDIARLLDEAVAALQSQQPAAPVMPADWAVFNSGACVADNLPYDEALEYMTPARLERGWTMVCVINKDNPPPAPGSAAPALVLKRLSEDAVSQLLDHYQNDRRLVGDLQAFNGIIRDAESALAEANGAVMGADSNT